MCILLCLSPWCLYVFSVMRTVSICVCFSSFYGHSLVSCVFFFLGEVLEYEVHCLRDSNLCNLVEMEGKVERACAGP